MVCPWRSLPMCFLCIFWMNDTHKFLPPTLVPGGVVAAGDKCIGVSSSFSQSERKKKWGAMEIHSKDGQSTFLKSWHRKLKCDRECRLTLGTKTAWMRTLQWAWAWWGQAAGRQYGWGVADEREDNRRGNRNRIFKGLISHNKAFRVILMN